MQWWLMNVFGKVASGLRSRSFSTLVSPVPFSLCLLQCQWSCILGSKSHESVTHSWMRCQRLFQMCWGKGLEYVCGVDHAVTPRNSVYLCKVRLDHQTLLWQDVGKGFKAWMRFSFTLAVVAKDPSDLPLPPALCWVRSLAYLRSLIFVLLKGLVG